MGQRGPKPRENAVTRHKPKQRRRNLIAERPPVPTLPAGFRAETVEWWAAWLVSPQTEYFAATDWQTLLRCAVLVDQFYWAPTAQLAAEIRQVEAKLGATASDRDRLGWKISEPESAPESTAVKHRDRPDPRKNAS